MSDKDKAEYSKEYLKHKEKLRKGYATLTEENFKAQETLYKIVGEGEYDDDEE